MAAQQGAAAAAGAGDHHGAVCPGFEWLGFPLATALLTFSIGLLFQASLPAAAISGVVMGAALYYAFDQLLDVTLPLGARLS